MILDPVLPVALVIGGALILVVFALWRMLRGPATGRREWIVRLGMVLLLLVIALRPSLPGSSNGPVATGGLEVYFVVDTTSSMAAEDAGVEIDARPGTRLDQAKADITGIALALPGAQFSLTTFDASTVQRVPLTSDVTALASATGAMTQEITYYSSGSSIDAPLSFVSDLLVQADDEHPERDRVLFYLGDGEQTVSSNPASFAELGPFIDGGAVIGYGTETGGEMRVFDGYAADDAGSAQTYIEDPTTGENAVSIVDRDTLATVGTQLGVPFAMTGDPQLRSIVDGIDVGPIEVSEASAEGPVEFYWIFAIPLGLLALREVLGTAIAVAAARPGRGRR